ncbi:MAG: hypothetical protein MHM6MM_001632 [Cercozoa sp. M6MM]
MMLSAARKALKSRVTAVCSARRILSTQADTTSSSSQEPPLDLGDDLIDNDLDFSSSGVRLSYEKMTPAEVFLQVSADVHARFPENTGGGADTFETMLMPGMRRYSLRTLRVSGDRRRMYRFVDIGESPLVPGWLSPRVDGRFITTAARSIPLSVPWPALAVALAGEFESQWKLAAAGAMPLTMVVTRALEQLLFPINSAQSSRIQCLERLEDFWLNDSVVNRDFDPSPRAKAAFTETLDPLMEWCEDKFDIELEDDVMSMLAATLGDGKAFDLNAKHWPLIKEYLDKMSPFELAAVEWIAERSKSLIIALAAHDGVLTARQLTEATLCEEYVSVKNEYGSATMEFDLRESRLQSELSAALLLFDLTRLEYDSALVQSGAFLRVERGLIEQRQSARQ